MPPARTLQACGLCDGAQFAVLGEAEARRVVEAAPLPGRLPELLRVPASGQNLRDLRALCILYPESLAERQEQLVLGAAEAAEDETERVAVGGDGAHAGVLEQDLLRARGHVGDGALQAQEEAALELLAGGGTDV